VCPPPWRASHLKAGESIDDFLDGFPTVTRAVVIAFLEEARSLTTPPEAGG
jgi:uncharacterized protein (DUF433 family)